MSQASGYSEDNAMENKETEIRKLGPIIETVWGVLLLVLSCALIVFAA